MLGQVLAIFVTLIIQTLECITLQQEYFDHIFRHALEHIK